MNILEESKKLLNSLPFELVIEEAAKRLISEFEDQNGRKFLFGHFRFVFNKGRFVGIEDKIKSRIYWSQGKKGASHDNSTN